MAVLLMAQAPHNNNNNTKNNKDDENPIFHDFFGTTCASDSPMLVKTTQRIDLSGEIKFPEGSASGGGGASSGGGHGPVSATSDLGSVERQMGSHFQGIPIHGTKNDFLGAEASNRFGRKRSNSDSIFMGLPTDRIPQIGSESVENFHLMKMLRSSAGGERPRRSHDEEFSFGVQPPNPNSTSHLTLQPSVDSRSDCVASKWDRSLMNVGPSAQYPSRFGQFAAYADKVSSRDGNAGPSISLPAADEGSRTGIKGSGILSVINAANGNERNASGVLLSSHRPKSGPQNADPEPSDSPRRAGFSSASRQMTIFYGGQAHVFDEVHPNKEARRFRNSSWESHAPYQVQHLLDSDLESCNRSGADSPSRSLNYKIDKDDELLSFRGHDVSRVCPPGSNGGSWSTTYSPKSSVLPNRDNGPGFSSAAFPQDLRGKLSIPRSSIHGYNQGGNTSAPAGGDRLNTMSSGHPGSMTPRPTSTRSLNQPAEPNSVRKQEG